VDIDRARQQKMASQKKSARQKKAPQVIVVVVRG
jgi:hypothetical protein